MADIVVPRLGVTVTEVTVVEWLVDEGKRISQGDPILLVATDKVESEIPAPASGVLRRAAAPEEVHPVGAVIGSID
jgi:pyruvate/2-oxoglutarate dehydrogenase complex dihydrolipoamide acyltransferase (E2) component